MKYISLCVWSVVTLFLYFVNCPCLDLKWTYEGFLEFIVQNEWLLKDYHHSWWAHIYRKKHTLSKNLLKHLIFHLTSFGEKSFYWLFIFLSHQSKQTGSLFMDPAFVTVSIHCQAGMQLKRVCAWCVYVIPVHMVLFDSMCVYVGLLTKKKWFLIVFLF